MKLDTEQDRSMLLETIKSASFSGAAIFVVADLVQRIQNAEVEDELKPDANGNVMSRVTRNKVSKAK